jgi:hypothetical protein
MMNLLADCALGTDGCCDSWTCGLLPVAILGSILAVVIVLLVRSSQSEVQFSLRRQERKK